MNTLRLVGDAMGNRSLTPHTPEERDHVGDPLGAKGLRRAPLIMQAYGGVLGIEASAKNAVGIIESGRAAGVVGSAFQGDLVGQRNILAADMGGTTFKVGVIRNGEV